MTVQTSVRRTRLTADGILTDFDFAFKIYNDTELLVYIVDTDDVATLQTLTTDYTIEIDSAAEEGTVTFLVAPTDQYEVLMIGSLPYTQGADIPVNEGFSEVVIENALDKLAIQIQQLKDLLDRTVSLSLTTELTGINLPDPVDGKALVWDGVAGDMTNSEIDVGDFDAAVAEAEVAQAAAEAAQADAETAQGLAETAQGLAEDAQTAAEAAAASFDQTMIEDADQDTKIQTEESADEDILRFDTAGSQRAQIDSDGLTLSAGASVNEFSTDGTLAGDSDDALPTEKAVKTYVDALETSILYENGTTYDEAAADTERSSVNNQTTYNKVKEFSPTVRGGNVTIAWQMKKTDAAADRQGQSRVYINDVATGSEKTTTGTGTTYSGYTESNLAVSPGDVIQIYAKVDNASAGTCDIKEVKIQTLNPTLPVEVTGL